MDSLLNLWYLHRQSGSTESLLAAETEKFSSNVPDSVFIKRLASINSFITLPYNETVRNYMIMYAEKMPSRMASMLSLAEYYFPIIEETLDAYNMPLELKYMAIIESALNPTAVSRVRAKGMWQFMYST
ncbi:MAG: lytic transglycosylase domain-containing protein, partial [Bacteroidales bacterium]|nr:lytic transglycosylase domain-containing protein [Bacteroidales bacterium]